MNRRALAIRLDERLRRWAAGLTPERRDLLRRLYQNARRHATIAVSGNMLRPKPFSTSYGADRGTPVDRWYLGRFMDAHREVIRGNVLEVQGTEWLVRAGHNAVEDVDVLDIDPGNTRATIIGDLCHADTLVPNSYDCAIVLQTLQYLRDPCAAVRNLWSALRAGGTLLISAPVISRLDPTCGPSGDLWRMTPAGLEHFLRASLPEASITVSWYGSVATGVAFLLGLPAEKLRSRQLAWRDEPFPLIACAAVTRNGRAP